MKKIILIISLFFLFSIQFVIASNTNINYEVFKKAIISRSYVRNNFKDWEKILIKIELYFNNIRKYRDIIKLKNLNNKTWELLIKFRKKEILTITEKKAFELVKNLYYRSYIELQRKY